MTLLPLHRRSLAALALIAALGSPAAFAHAILTASTPAAGGTIAAGRQHLTFRFNSRIDQPHSRLTLTGPDGRGVVLPVVAGGIVNALEADADLIPGAYKLRWQALALDGHITRGDVPFTVTGPAAAAPTF